MRYFGVLLLLLLPQLAVAGLGGQRLTADPARLAAKAVRESTPSAAYSVSEIETEDGATIREYVLPSGIVFAVTWSGPRVPDLRELFGSHFQSYRDEIEARPAGRGPVRIERADLIVEAGGRMRAFRGRAWLPQRLPAGMTVDEIR